MRNGGLTVHQIDRQTQTDHLIHRRLARVVFFATTVFRLPVFRTCRFRGLALFRPADFPDSSPASLAQASDARTARCHPAIHSDAASLGIAGVKRVKLRVPMNSDASLQTPPAIPASPAAPSAVVSIMSGRSTGMPSTSDWNCSNQLLAEAPPSTRSDSNFTRLRLAITDNISAVPYAIASSAALVKCARFDPRVSPTIVPRALGSQFGAPSPTSAGTK